jgi:hypothetical protein
LDSGKGQGGMGKMPFLLPLLPPDPDRGGPVWPRPAVGAGATGVGGGQGVGQNDGGFTGGRFPYLPWAVVAHRGGSLGIGGLEDGRLGGTVLWCSIKGRRWLWWCVAARGATGPFYWWRKVVRLGIFLSSGSFDGRQWRWRGKISRH